MSRWVSLPSMNMLDVVASMVRNSAHLKCGGAIFSFVVPVAIHRLNMMMGRVIEKGRLLQLLMDFL